MEDDLLEEYLDQEVVLFFAPAFIFPTAEPCEEGVLYDYSKSGVVLEKAGGMLTFVPISAIQKIQIKPKLSFWQRLIAT